MKPVSLTTLVLCFVLTSCPQTWATGLQFFMNRTEQQLQCIMDTDTTDKSTITEISITDFSDPKNKLILASASVHRPDLYIESQRNISIEVNGSISKHQAKLDIRFNTNSECELGNYLCEVTFMSLAGHSRRKHAVVEAKIPNVIKGKLADYSDVMLSVQVKELQDTFAQTVNLLANLSEGFEERLVNLINRVESFELSSTNTCKSHQGKQDAGSLNPAPKNSHDSYTKMKEDGLSSYQSEEDHPLQLQVIPEKLLPPLTKVMLVNCTLNYDEETNLSTVLSFSISKTSNERQKPRNFVELVSLNALDNNRINVLSEIYKASVSGHVGTGDVFYLSMQWSYPSGVEAGLYQCEVRGMDDTGHITVITKSAQVTTQEPNFSELIEKFSDLQRELEHQQQTQSQCCISLQSELDRMEMNHNETISIIQGELSNFKDQNTRLQQQDLNLTNKINYLQSQSDRVWKLATILSTDKYYASGIYDNHYYLLSKQSWSDASVHEETCEKFGGFLAEVDNAQENTFIINFVNQYSDVTHVLLGGTDEIAEGIWVFRYSGKGVVFTNWRSGEPGEDRYDCMAIYRGYSWQMYDEKCKYTFGASVRFLCEIPM